MPQVVKDLFAASGTLGKVPWDGRPAPEPPKFWKQDQPEFDWSDPEIDPSNPANLQDQAEMSDEELEAYLKQRLDRAREKMGSEGDNVIDLVASASTGDEQSSGDGSKFEPDVRDDEYFPGASHLNLLPCQLLSAALLMP